MGDVNEIFAPPGALSQRERTTDRDYALAVKAGVTREPVAHPDVADIMRSQGVSHKEAQAQYEDELRRIRGIYSEDMLKDMEKKYNISPQLARYMAIAEVDKNQKMIEGRQRALENEKLQADTRRSVAHTAALMTERQKYQDTTPATAGTFATYANQINGTLDGIFPPPAPPTNPVPPPSPWATVPGNYRPR